MSRYIDADALIMALRLEYPMIPMFKENRKEWEIKTEGYRKAEEVIKEAPSIDIVFCKECKHAHMTYGGDCKYCDMWKDDDDFYIELYLDGDFYCAYGERKESE